MVDCPVEELNLVGKYVNCSWSSEYQYHTGLYSTSTLHIELSLSTQDGNTPLYSAALKGHSEVVKLLLQAGARDIPNKVFDYLKVSFMHHHLARKITK